MTRVQGFAELERRWLRVPQLVRKQLRYEMEEIADQLVSEMYSLAPHLTGEGAGSIDWTWGDAPAGSFTVGTVGGRKYGAMRITIYAGGGRQFYMRLQEFGTRKMAANPFFYPVWRARRRRAKGRMTRAINKAIKEV